MDQLTIPKVFTIPGSHPFLDSLADGLRNQFNTKPEALSGATVLLPTRRACRAMRDAFLRKSGGTPVLLPQLLPLGDIDEDELQISTFGGMDDGIEIGGHSTISTPPAIPRLRREILLARLILANPHSVTGPNQAVRLARELARLLDQVHTEKLSFDRLKDLVPNDFAGYWQTTLDFLKVITDAWPKLLSAEGFLDPAEHRNILLLMLSNLWRDSQPKQVVIAAGSTGSIPATANLLSEIARLQKGAVILPALDLEMEETVWNQLEPTHPQYGMAKLLRQMKTSRKEVSIWPGIRSRRDDSRTRFVNAAMTPAAAPQPVLNSIDFRKSIKGLIRLDCPGPREEATAIALMLREVLEKPNRTAALVTPDRKLARRVTEELKRWQIEVDDSAGKPLSRTPPGLFLCLIAEAVDKNLAPVPLLALLKHPLTTMGYSPKNARRLANHLEITTLRGPRPKPGIIGLREACPNIRVDLKTLINRLENILNPLMSLSINSEINLSEIMRLLTRVAESLAATDKMLGQDRVWNGEAGMHAAEFVADILKCGDSFQIKPPDFATLLRTFMANRVVRSRHALYPRLAIWGTLEARLQTADLLILGGLNEGVWPPQTSANPWMSRPMMKQFGLPLPERRIGLSAHDFTQCLNARSVVLTRAERVDGTPTVPCRWLRRIENLLMRLENPNALKTSTPWLKWVEAIDRPVSSINIAPPRPTPPAKARPSGLSVTEIETLIRNPYAIYARHILRLFPIEPIDADPGAAERGKIIHTILEEFIATYPKNLPDNTENKILDIGRRHFNSHMSRPGVRAFWWPRFRRIAAWFAKNEYQRRKMGWLPLGTEIEGKRVFTGLETPFTLIARADRIDKDVDGNLSIIDYKTGQPPSDKQISAGLTPQLPLEAAIAKVGGYQEIDGEVVSDLTYMQLSGGREPGNERPIKLDVEQITEDAISGLARLIKKYENPATPYLSQPRPMFQSHFETYDHLARLKEWRGQKKNR